MSKFKIKGLPPIKLTDILKKKKTNLKNFLSSFGITAYATLLQKCEKMGVSPPNEEEFKEAVGASVSSPQEGIIVLDPPTILKETGEKIEIEEPASEPAVPKTPLTPKRKRRIAIDESVYVTPSEEDRYEKSDAEMGDSSTVEDNLDDSISKLSTLKSSK